MLMLTLGWICVFCCAKNETTKPPSDLKSPAAVTITMDETKLYQTIDGFGASLTDSSAWLLANAMSQRQRQAALEELFDPKKGIGLTYLRQPMGTSDFRVSSAIGGHGDYTYDDMPPGKSDYELSRFSIAKDKDYIIPMLKKIVAINPDIRIMGSPWSAPYWMKEGETMGGGRLKDDVYETYARYFEKYIEAYAKQGLRINAVTMQNEPQFEPGTYHGTLMKPQDQIKLALAMGPLLKARHPDVKILVWDHNWDVPEYPIEVLNDAKARIYISGTAFHHYAGNPAAQTQVHNAHPDREIYFTEGSNGEWQPPGFDSNFIETTSRMIDILRNWSRTFIMWNLVLDTENGPKISGGCDTCYGIITVDQSDGSISRRPQYYTFGHSSKFVRPGAQRIDSTDSRRHDVANVAFVNPDGSRVIIALNNGSSPNSIRVNCAGRAFEYSLPARSVATFVWDDQPDASVQVWLTTGDQTRLLSRQTDLHFSNE
jgi:glucosylceramidase